MSDGEVLACSKFYVSFDGLEDLIVKKVSGISITLETAGDSTPFGVTKDGKSQIQATVTGTSNGKLTVEYVATVDDRRRRFDPAWLHQTASGLPVETSASRNFFINRFFVPIV
jgi:hypothetical protein